MSSRDSGSLVQSPRALFEKEKKFPEHLCEQKWYAKMVLGEQVFKGAMYMRKKRFCAWLLLALCFLMVSVVKSSPGPAGIRYAEVTVRGGDTLWQLAAQHCGEKEDVREKIYAIRDLNRLTAQASLTPGQKLKIPLKSAD